MTVTMQIENQAYPVNVEALHTVFTPYGFVQKIACFEKNNTWQVSTPRTVCIRSLTDIVLLYALDVLLSAELVCVVIQRPEFVAVCT